MISTAPEEFKLDVGQDVLADLAWRLNQTRWPNRVPGAAWKVGTDQDYMVQLQWGCRIQVQQGRAFDPCDDLLGDELRRDVVSPVLRLRERDGRAWFRAFRAEERAA
jgi:hypothetical protein